MAATDSSKIRLVGAGGRWQVLNERFDPLVIKQATSLSCVAAVGEMLLQSRGIKLAQYEILAKIGQPATVQRLAGCLNEVDVLGEIRWHGLFVATGGLRLLARTGVWGAVLREGNPLGHLVVVEDLTKQDLVAIKDPYDATRYEMQREEFLLHWGGEAVFRWKF